MTRQKKIMLMLFVAIIVLIGCSLPGEDASVDPSVTGEDRGTYKTLTLTHSSLYSHHFRLSPTSDCPSVTVWDLFLNGKLERPGFMATIGGEPFEDYYYSGSLARGKYQLKGRVYPSNNYIYYSNSVTY